MEGRREGREITRNNKITDVTHNEPRCRKFKKKNYKRKINVLHELQ